ncbi:Uncharacterised protein [Chryseobacterium taihuense]|uniref:Uncharacterized protein n=2 Tax=Chryseobacterium TaxID=59732 RepID=A0A101CHY1_9FLAO|nr:hypothetical protein AR686_06625 [Chryseobacterium aquaticum subsp. greenlandense]VFB04960.1 Uncharacterised protein [Chryseobacterium taihuense]
MNGYSNVDFLEMNHVVNIHSTSYKTLWKKQVYNQKLDCDINSIDSSSFLAYFILNRIVGSDLHTFYRCFKFLLYHNK